MLKEQLSDKIGNLGISFESIGNRTSVSNKVKKPVDGYIQLIQAQKKVDELTAENTSLRN